MGVFQPFTNARGWTRNAAREKYLPVCNADGGMSRERLQKVLEVSGISGEEIPVIANQIDKGSSGIISLEDLLDFLGYEADPEDLEAAVTLAGVMQTEEGRESLRSFFETLDKDKNGKVSSKEWGHALGKNKEFMAKYFGGSTPAEIGQAFKRIDANKDGNLSWEEFVEAADAKSAQTEASLTTLSEVMKTDEGWKSLMDFFETLDKDKNGKVSSKEWGHALGKNKELMAKYFGGSTPAEIGQAFKRIDANSDGHLTWEEFVAAADMKAKS